MDHCLDPDRWTSQGLLGEILEEIHSELQLPRVCEPSATSHNPNTVNHMDIDPVPKTGHEQSEEMMGLPVETNISSNSASQLYAQT